MSVNLKIRYFTDEYQWLCFKHAVELTNEGKEVHSTIEAYGETYSDSTVCELCYNEYEDEEEDWERIHKNEEELMEFFNELNKNKRKIGEVLKEMAKRKPKPTKPRMSRLAMQLKNMDRRIIEQKEDAF
jgi:hypothetical protein